LILTVFLMFCSLFLQEASFEDGYQWFYEGTVFGHFHYLYRVGY
jgi:hypothetical protein